MRIDAVTRTVGLCAVLLCLCLVTHWREAWAAGGNIFDGADWAKHVVQWDPGGKGGDSNRKITQTVTLIDGWLVVRQESDKVVFTKDGGVTHEVKPGVDIQRVKVGDMGTKVDKSKQWKSSNVALWIHTKSDVSKIQIWKCEGDGAACGVENHKGVYSSSLALYFGDEATGDRATAAIIAEESK